MNHSEIERKVREATDNDEPWGPHGTLMTEIAKATFSYSDFPLAMVGVLPFNLFMLIQRQLPQSQC